MKILQIEEGVFRAKVDNTLRDLQNSSYSTKAEFNNCFIIHFKLISYLGRIVKSISIVHLYREI